MTKLKICGVTRPEDLVACAELGADAVGINLWSGSKRGLSVSQARTLLESDQTPAGRRPQRVGVFVDASVTQVQDAAAVLRLDAIQLHDDRDPSPFAALGIPWVWVLRGTPELAELRAPSPSPAWILLDAKVDGFGGRGRKTDWTWAAGAVEHFAEHEVWLAGGLTVDNAAQAIARVRPAGLDVASGAEPAASAHGEKDADRIAQLLAACRSDREE